jgi:hypothetical protein
LQAVKSVRILLTALLLCVPILQGQEVPKFTRQLVAQSAEDRLVWVNTATGVYHYPGTRWYGKTRQGKFMSESDAKAQGYRPAENGQ